MCSGNVRCWQHFLSALFSAALAGYDGAKHDKRMTAAGAGAERGAEVPAGPDVNTNLHKWDKRRAKRGEAQAPWGKMGGGGGKRSGAGCSTVAALLQPLE